ncbi:hypothetical protein SAMD00019534_059830 [Acytostelium subglobosum LB1]|uniref:hypothetical protein n=1 Tax=Acytostelium subglobosum LB1 TaxID=1410327 RepID=UPI000644A3A5|nr:hypothetical protein SAMD00019534_059830 [Acytostelium subglobosum LB1]GAM22808.1 hypothetical protein SAMD00019534_059830 [Acytostelium subglobosum LB1]|eukprot:XP_012754035.1 hypothetical protein SAMD00019534_059830 [Acytostelium subglobosum LB1]
MDRLSSVLLGEICNKLINPIDRLCMTLVSKTLFQRKHQYLTFNVDHLLYWRNTGLGYDYTQPVGDVAAIECGPLIDTTSSRTSIRLPGNKFRSYNTQILKSLQTTPGLVILSLDEMDDELVIPDDANIVKLVIVAPERDTISTLILPSRGLPRSITHLEIKSYGLRRAQRISILNMSALSITRLDISSIHCVGDLILPSTITHLDVDQYSNVPITAIPTSVTSLSIPPHSDANFLNVGFIQRLKSLRTLKLVGRSMFHTCITQFNLIGVSPSLTHLHLGDRFKAIIMPGDLPSTLRHLSFGTYFNQPLPVGSIPDSVETLSFGQHFNQSLNCIGTIPNSVTSLTLGFMFQQDVTYLSLAGDNLHTLDTLPKTVHTLYLRFFSYSPDLDIPTSVTRLEWSVPGRSVQLMTKLTPSITSLSLHFNSIPSTILLSNIHPSPTPSPTNPVRLVESNNIESYSEGVTVYGRVIDGDTVVVLSSDFSRGGFVSLSQLHKHVHPLLPDLLSALFVCPSRSLVLHNRFPPAPGTIYNVEEYEEVEFMFDY